MNLLSLVLFLLSFPVCAAGQALHYVSVAGDDLAGDGSRTRPYRTIQRAIDISGDRDSVIVLPGRYHGPGNTNISFGGKSLTLRSEDPGDEACVRATVIDAEGAGVLVRFVNDEGPDSIFSGFTLLPGDTSAHVPRGVPGFFEFSPNARPTTSHLRVGEDEAAPPKSVAWSAVGSLPEPVTSVSGRAWDGNNPFHQPVATTDYYGSGDLNLDGNLSSEDLFLAQEMASGGRPPGARADVDGNGIVDAADAALLQNAVNGATLPGWWNKMAGRGQRESWIGKVMALDPGQQHPYGYWWQCLSFSVQLFLRTGSYLGDLFATDYNGGQTAFNLPVYTTSVASSTYGHAINAILTGDDPLQFSEWLFLEPQTDGVVSPGMWDMPFDTRVSIQVPTAIQRGGHNGARKIEFLVSASGQTLQSHSPDLLLARPALSERSPENRPDLWNPRVLPGNPGYLLFERTRDDLSRSTDIHLSSLPLVDPPQGVPLTRDPELSRLLDVTQGNDGRFHLLWHGKSSYVRGVFYGILDPVTRTMTDVVRISEGSRDVNCGRIAVKPDGEVHAFWLEDRGSSYHPYAAGVYWTVRKSSGWQAAENLTPPGYWLSEYRDGNNRHLLRYFFDVAVTNAGELLIVWPNRSDSFSPLTITYRRYDGAWGPPAIIEQTSYVSGGFDLVTASDGTLHLSYWLGDKQGPSDLGWDGRGNLFHRSYSGGVWSLPITVDGSSGACCPHAVSAPDGAVYLTWERRDGSRAVPAWTRYRDGGWRRTQTLNVPAGIDAWYPSAALLPHSRLAITWSARSPERVSIGQEILNAAGDQPPQIEAGGVINAATLQPGIASSAWVAIKGTSLAPHTRLWRFPEDFAGNLLPTQLDGVSVRINGKAAYVYYISPDQINVLAPDDPYEGPVQVEVTTSYGTSAPVTALKQKIAPAFFMFNEENRKYIAGVHLDGVYLGKPDLFPGTLPSRPAKPGGVIVLFGTGFGPTEPPCPAAELVGAPGWLVTPLTLRVGGVAATVSFAGLTMSGLYQFNVTVPQLPDGDHPVTVEIGGVRTQDGAFITVQK